MSEDKTERLAELLHKFEHEHLQNVRDGVRSPDFTNVLAKDIEELQRTCDSVVVELFALRKQAELAVPVEPYADMLMQSGLVKDDEGAVDALARLLVEARDRVTAKATEIETSAPAGPGLKKATGR